VIAGAHTIIFAARDDRWGRTYESFGAGEIGLYEPRHPSPLQEFA
jgi:hypothetical protein